MPVVSTAIDLASAATGRNFYEGGRKMRGAERLTMLGGAALGMVPGVGAAAKAGLAVAKGVKKAKAARKTENAVTGSCAKGVRNSFLPATLVLADGTSTPISDIDIDIGDVVLATDPDTGQTVGRPVTALIEGTGLKHLVDITVAGDLDGPLTATDGHPFWVDGQGCTDADDLAVGDLLRQADADLVPVTAVRTYDVIDATVHNLTIADLHTYYVHADEPVLVHNCGGGLEAKDLETGRGKLLHDPRAGESPHTRNKLDGQGRTTKYTTMVRNKRTTDRWLEVRRFRRSGRPHNKISPPLVIGRGKGTAGRKPFLWEIPRWLRNR